MLVESKRDILIECPKCTELNKFNLDLFKLKSNNQIEFDCKCGERNILFSLSQIDKSMVDIEVNCFYCHSIHIYPMKIKDIGCKNISFSCTNGEKICLVGKNLVRKKENKNKTILNSKILEIALEKIYTLYESGNIYCQCGSNNIIVEVFPDNIKIKCNDCNCSKFIRYKGSDDIRNLLINSRIELRKSTYYI